MGYVERLQNVSILGAGGKMGSGIALLTALELADLSLDPTNKGVSFALNAIDLSQASLTGLLKYLQTQVRKAAEKKINTLRHIYQDRKDLIENDDMITQYINDVMANIRPSTHLEVTYDSDLIFEAVFENIDLKAKLLSQIKANNSKDFWVLTNTSSIPISELDNTIGLNGRIIGFHFYNPPAVQKLAELITTDSTNSDLIDFSTTFAKKLRKVIVPSNDVPGFIGNGYLIRDILHGISEVNRLSQEYTVAEALYMINKISQEFLIRPMGIFQLVDYVGLDVCKCIQEVMDTRLINEDLSCPMMDTLLDQGIKGGQFSSGAQKDGILKYDRGRLVGVYDPNTQEYQDISTLSETCDPKLGTVPESFAPWKSVISRPDKNEFLTKYFAELNTMDTLGADLARKYGKKSKEIGLGLIENNVAANEKDVNTVLLTGFYHAYGPINDYFN